MNSSGYWGVIFEGKKRINITLEWADALPQIKTETDLKRLMSIVQSLKTCSGCDIDKYKTVLPRDESLPIYCTRSGEPAAFVEAMPSKYHTKVIRSTHCMVFFTP